MDPGHIGTGGVNQRASPLCQRLIGGPSLSVGADDHRRARLRLLRTLDESHTQGGKILNHTVVVNNGAQHDTGPALRRRLLRHPNRPADPIAKPGGLGQL